MFQCKQLAVVVNGKIILEDVTTSLKQEGIIMVMGRNGSGKTTFLSTVAGLLPYNGSLQFDGKVAYVPQEFDHHNETTVFDMLLRALKAKELPLVEQLSRVENVMKDLGLQEALHRRFTDLSGAQKRMVLLARALLMERQILVLDEVLTGLDDTNALAMLSIIRHYVESRRAMALMSIHGLDRAKAFGDYFLLLKDGRIFKEGPAHTVFHEDIYQLAFL